MHLASDVEVGTGRHALCFEFEPHGEPDVTKGHGMPGSFQSTSTASWSATEMSPTRRRSPLIPGR